jgi:hypothetical protein
MASGVTIGINEIRAAVDRVLDAVERKHGPSLVLDHDYYWALPVKDSFDIYGGAQPALTTGQLSDDVAGVRELLTSGEVLSPWHELAHLVGVLRAIEALDLDAP